MHLSEPSDDTKGFPAERTTETSDKQSANSPNKKKEYGPGYILENIFIKEFIEDSSTDTSEEGREGKLNTENRDDPNEESGEPVETDHVKDASIETLEKGTEDGNNKFLEGDTTESIIQTTADDMDAKEKQEDVASEKKPTNVSFGTTGVSSYDPSKVFDVAINGESNEGTKAFIDKVSNYENQPIHKQFTIF